MNHELRFEAYKSHPSPESLLSLLQACEATIYNLCYRILRQPQDAEDASQRVLLETLSALPRIPDGDWFQRWIYRTSFNIAWNLKKARTRRRAHEGRKAESAASVARTASETVAERVHEALSNLDDAE